jgi:hypothetical protein
MENLPQGYFDKVSLQLKPQFLQEVLQEQELRILLFLKQRIVDKFEQI